MNQQQKENQVLVNGLVQAGVRAYQTPQGRKWLLRILVPMVIVGLLAGGSCSKEETVSEPMNQEIQTQGEN